MRLTVVWVAEVLLGLPSAKLLMCYALVVFLKAFSLVVLTVLGALLVDS
jgi:hypothetical protein